MTNQEKLDFVKENSKYWNSELIKPLKLTNDEFVAFFPRIKMIVDEAEMCEKNGKPNICINESFMHSSLERDTNGQLIMVAVPCPKKQLHDLWVENDFICNTKAKTLPTFQSIAAEHRQDKKSNKLECVKLLLNIRDAVKKREKPMGLYIYGTYGIGKSFLLYRFCEELQKYGLSTAFVFTPELVDRFRSTFNDESSVNTDYYINKYSNVDVLVLDDIGAEKPVGWFYDSLLPKVLTKRMNEERLTFFTSNFTLDGLLKKWTGKTNTLNVDAGRIGERIRALTNNVQFKLIDKNNRY